MSSRATPEAAVAGTHSSAASTRPRSRRCMATATWAKGSGSLPADSARRTTPASSRSDASCTSCAHARPRRPNPTIASRSRLIQRRRTWGRDRKNGWSNTLSDPGGSPRPSDAQEVFFLVVVILQLALVGGVRRLADVAREMGIGRRDEHAVLQILDRHDPLERMLSLLVRLAVADEVHDLVSVRAEELARERDVPGGELVADAGARGADRLVRARGRRAPGPASAVIHGPAFRAARRLGQLLLRLVAVMDELITQLVTLQRAPVSAFRFHRAASLPESNEHSPARHGPLDLGQTRPALKSDPRRLDWNVIVTVKTGPGQERDLLGALARFGRFRPTPFRGVCMGRVDDVEAFLAAILKAREAGKPWAERVARVIPVERVFLFAPETLTDQLRQAVAPFVARMSDGSFCVRLERRGLAGRLPSAEIERAVS